MAVNVLPPDVRVLTDRDINDVWDLQVVSYASRYHEPQETFEAFLHAFPQGCFGAFQDGSLCGYGFGLPWLRFEVLELRLQDLTIPSRPTTFHVHDIAMHPNFRGRRVGESLLRLMFQVAADNGLDHVELIAVDGADGYWKRFGFKASTDGAAAAEAYGEDAVYMEGSLAGSLTLPDQSGEG